MRRIAGVALLALLALPSFSQAAFACRIEACDLRQFFTEAEFENFKKNAKRIGETRSKRAAMERSGKPDKGARLDLSLPAASKTKTHNLIAPEPTTSLKFILRKDFEDIRLFSNIVPNADAEGAEFSVTRDNIKRDTTWSADALAALAYIYTVENIHSTFMGFAIAPYVRINREIHSTLIDNNVDTTAFGLSGEVGFRNRLFGSSDHLRGRMAVVRDGLTSAEMVHATGEWIPYYLSRFGTIPGTFINYNFIPEVKAQYDSTTASGKIIQFSGRSESLRVGPEATVRFKMVAPDGPLYDYLRRLTGKITYHWWTELYSGRQDSWLDTSLTFNVDPEGFIGLKASYRRGRSEETGAQTDLYKLGLTAKVCADVLSMETC